MNIIINPITGKSYLVKSKNGRQILKKYIQSYLNGGSYSGEKSVHERRDRHMIHATKEGYTGVVMDVIAKYKKRYHKRRRWPLVLNKLLLTVKDSDDDDNTLLHLAAKYGRTEIMKQFLDVINSHYDYDVAKKIINAKNKNNKSPLNLAKDSGKTKIMEMLVDAGAVMEETPMTPAPPENPELSSKKPVLPPIPPSDNSVEEPDEKSNEKSNEKPPRLPTSPSPPTPPITPSPPEPEFDDDGFDTTPLDIPDFSQY